MKFHPDTAPVEPPCFRAVVAICLLLLLACGRDALAAGPETNSTPEFTIRAYEVRGDTVLTNYPAERLSSYTGTNLTVADIVKAASQLQREHFALGCSNLTIAVARERVTNGVVVLNVFRSRVPRLLISGRDYPLAGEESRAVASAPGAPPPAARTNAVPRFTVLHYEIHGDTLLSIDALTKVLLKYTGTNLAITDIMKAASDLQMEYRDRGFPTVRVTIPEQRITNDIVKFRVIEGRLSDISVTGNRYFSSNNVVRALPSLRTNMILNGPVFQAELDRANANQDRQIYPEIEPGPTEGTTDLNLKVKDRLPLHAKVDFNNQNSPGTPDLRLNTSIAYNNLWQLEHSIGLQYGFSPEQYKTGNQWNFYDLPLVANYSGFYRLPLGDYSAVQEAVSTSGGNFGYDEASRRFRLPAPSGRPELNVYGSRSTIDTGLEQFPVQEIYNVPGVRQVTRQDVQQDVTINQALGFRLSDPLPQIENIRSSLSAGLDYKTYDLTSSKSNIFRFSEITVDANGNPNPPIYSTVVSPVPLTSRALNYLPLSARWDASRPDSLGFTSFGLGLGGNSWYSGTSTNLHLLAASTTSSGYWFVLNPSLSRDFRIYTNWTLSLHAEGQWTDQPLISNEQYGIGGVNSVRGYHEGEIFGDTGWWTGIEQKTPPHYVGLVYRNHPLTVRGSIYMEYGESYLLDPQGRNGRTPLWGTGFGGVASIGATWEARFLFSWPLLSAGTTSAYQPRFDFGINAQF